MPAATSHGEQLAIGVADGVMSDPFNSACGQLGGRPNLDLCCHV
jgi:hypothetical protein